MANLEKCNLSAKTCEIDVGEKERTALYCSRKICSTKICLFMNKGKNPIIQHLCYSLEFGTEIGIVFHYYFDMDMIWILDIKCFDLDLVFKNYFLALVRK